MTAREGSISQFPFENLLRKWLYCYGEAILAVCSQSAFMRKRRCFLRWPRVNRTGSRMQAFGREIIANFWKPSCLKYLHRITGYLPPAYIEKVLEDELVLMLGSLGKPRILH